MVLSTPGSGSGTANGNVNDNGNGSDDTTISMDGTQRINQELPFLVTHWLANYRSSSSNDNNNISNEETQHQEREREAMAKIRRATSDIASALASIGAYGTTFRVSALQ